MYFHLQVKAFVICSSFGFVAHDSIVFDAASLLLEQLKCEFDYSIHSHLIVLVFKTRFTSRSFLTSQLIW